MKYRPGYTVTQTERNNKTYIYIIAAPSQHYYGINANPSQKQYAVFQFKDYPDLNVTNAMLTEILSKHDATNDPTYQTLSLAIQAIYASEGEPEKDSYQAHKSYIKAYQERHTTFSISLPITVKARWKKEAASRNLSLAKLLYIAVEDYLKKGQTA